MSPYQQRVYDLRVQDKGIKEIAAEIGKSYWQINSVIQMLRRKGILDKPLSKRIMHEATPDIDGDVENGLRCKHCWLLFPADCTPDKCMAREDPFNDHLLGIAKMITAAEHYAEKHKWE